MAREVLYQDELIKELREKCRLAQEQIEVTEQNGYKRVLLNDGLCSIMLPAKMRDMRPIERQVKYRNIDDSVIVQTDERGDATFTFSLTGQRETASEKNMETEETGETAESMQDGMEGVLQNTMEKLRADMQKMWKHIVFYDTGTVYAGTLPVVWTDCKTSCIDGSLYCLLSLFMVNGQLILGNFHCSFPRYDIWKPEVIRLLATIQP